MSAKRREQGGGRQRNVRKFNESEIKDILSPTEDKDSPESVTKLLLPVLETSGGSGSVEIHGRLSESRQAPRGTAAVNFSDKAILEAATKGGEPHARVLEEVMGDTGPFGFVDRDVLTFRGNLLFPSSPSNYPDGRIYVVQPSSVDGSIFFLTSVGVWRLGNRSSADGADAVSLAAGPFPDVRAFTIVDVDMYGGQGRFLLVSVAEGKGKGDTLRAFRLDSYEPPFSIRNVTGLETNILTLVGDPSRPNVYFTTDKGIFKMQLPLYGFGSIVPLVREESAIGSAQASSPGDAGFERVRLSQHAFSAYGQLMYVADCYQNSVYRVWFPCGQVERIQGGSVAVDLACPYGLALTSDGCNLFVSEFRTGRITLITFESNGGHVRSIRTLAGRSSGRYTESSMDLFGLAISPGGSYLYVGADDAIYKFDIDTWGLPSCSNSYSAAVRSSSPQAAKKQTDLTPVVITLAVVLPVVCTAFGALLVWCLCGLQRRRREAESRAIERPVQSIDTIDARAPRSQQIEPVAFTNNSTGAGNWWQRPAGGGTLANDRLDVVAA
ncbi:hypothetical protein CBR_g1185 [Chara braunii]|uniref:SMP-30/Gluconolactonase/LRE-like region domain-containing protein n=1 Tax=Chara braunii TaxID=69332 RepID=A0A388KDD2_CHABU|nr:hypothetical protein CBR_g1185 [Chara braunii]|eukprot:GBG68064.1 hypothetical protein CBR_g1185 [Chara braunii]